MKYTKNASQEEEEEEEEEEEFPCLKKTNEATIEGVNDNKILEVAMEINRLEDFPNFPKDLEVTPYNSTWEELPFAHVTGGGITPTIVGTINRKFEESMSINQHVFASVRVAG